MKGFYCFCLFFSLAILTIPGCKKKEESNTSLSPSLSTVSSAPQVISINISEEPQTLDPRKMYSLRDLNLGKMFFEGLVRIGKEGKPLLALAKEVDVSEDCKTYTITLKRTKWSNGDLVTADDFIYAWKTALSPYFIAPHANILYPIKNAEAIKTGALPSSLLGAEAVSENTLKIELAYPAPYFLEATAHPVFFPIHSKVDRVTPNWAREKESFVGNGPFTLHKWKHHNRIEVRKNQTYWDADHVQLDELKLVMFTPDTALKLFETNELNWSGSPFSTIPINAIKSLKEQHQLKTAASLATRWISVNVESFPFTSQKMRRAFAFALNRQALVNEVIQGTQTVANALVPSGMGLSSHPYFQDGDLAKGRELFEEALEELNIGRESISTIPFLYISSDEMVPLAKALQSQWEEAFGVPIELEGVSAELFFDRMSRRDYTLSFGNRIADFNDPICFLDVFESKSEAINSTNWENPHYQELLDQSRYFSQTEERKALFRESEELLMREMPVIPLYHSKMLYIQDERLKNVVFTPTGIVDFKSAYLENRTVAAQ